VLAAWEDTQGLKEASEFFFTLLEKWPESSFARNLVFSILVNGWDQFLRDPISQFRFLHLAMKVKNENFVKSVDLTYFEAVF